MNFADAEIPFVGGERDTDAGSTYAVLTDRCCSCQAHIGKLAGSLICMLMRKRDQVHCCQRLVGQCVASHYRGERDLGTVYNLGQQGLALDIDGYDGETFMMGILKRIYSL